MDLYFLVIVPRHDLCYQVPIGEIPAKIKQNLGLDSYQTLAWREALLPYLLTFLRGKLRSRFCNHLMTSLGSPLILRPRSLRQVFKN